mmetsp:Transcript_450/g.610  ORF Transcript_450/g.610 Transcript_450/m.610 type:complete len:350 (+) Transcript_450:78-1127(+)
MRSTISLGARRTTRISLALAAAWLVIDAAEGWSPSAIGVLQGCSLSDISNRNQQLFMAPVVGSTAEATHSDAAPTRRQFLYKSVATATAFVLSTSTQAANAAEEEEVVVADAAAKAEVVADAAAEAELIKEEKAAEAELIKDEKEVIDEIVVEESEEKQASEDTNKLISELEEQITKEEKESGGDDSLKPGDEETTSIQSTKTLIDTLEKEEEILESETKELISKVETLEKAEELQQNKQDASSSSPSEASPATTATSTETLEFLSKLKERVEEKEDLIAILKRESQKDVDPKTGKFKPMTGKDFKARKPVDFEFLQLLKESVTNNQEFERDVDAFKGLLEKRFGQVLH